MLWEVRILSSASLSLGRRGRCGLPPAYDEYQVGHQHVGRFASEVRFLVVEFSSISSGYLVAAYLVPVDHLIENPVEHFIQSLDLVAGYLSRRRYHEAVS